MSVRTENQCVGCPPEMGCLGSACPNMNVKIYSCDYCGDDFNPEELYEAEDGHMLCGECLLKGYRTIAQAGL